MTEKIRKPIGKRKKLPQFTIMNVIEGQAGLENYSSLFFYSLTIDNILNIIVLLILAGVALNLTIGENGLFTRAQNAANTWQLAEQNEQNALNDLASWLDEIIGNNNDNEDDNNKSLADITGNETSNTTTKDKYGNPITIPAGFKVVNPDDDVTKGIVIEDVSANGEGSTTVGSQFVWIPVGDVITDTSGSKTTITLGRYTFASNGTATPVQTAENWSQEVAIETYYKELATSDYGNTTAKNLEEFITKATASGGYYIGRYKAGDATAKTSQHSSSGTTNPVTCKSGVYPYTSETQSQASSLCQQMYKSDTNRNFQSDLINSYAWDTAIVFIQKFSGDGNYSRQVGKNTEGSLQKCGESTLATVDSGDKAQDVRCNIYDMAGNTREWTTETYSDTSAPCGVRGGDYDDTYFYTSRRFLNSTTTGYSNISFRPTLYL